MNQNIRIPVYAVLGALIVASLTQAAPARKKVRGGEALQRKKSLNFDGRSVEAIDGGRFNSFTNLSEDDGRGDKKLYELPANFAGRVAEEADEMRYRK